MKAEFKEILAREREIKEERKREEEEIDRTFAKLMKIEEENEKMKGSSEKVRLIVRFSVASHACPPSTCDVFSSRVNFL